MKLVESDKRKMVQDLRAYRANAKAQYIQHSPVSPDAQEPTPWTATTGYASTIGGTTVDSTTPLEPKRGSIVSQPDADGWVTFNRPLSYVYAGKGPYVSKDFMQFPVSIPDDGLLDVVAQELVRSLMRCSLWPTHPPLIGESESHDHCHGRWRIW